MEISMMRNFWMLSFTTRNTGLVITVSTQLFTAWIFSVLL